MALEIRTLTSDDIADAEAISAEAFANSHRRDMAAAVERALRLYQPDWYLGAFDAGEMTAMMRIIPLAMKLNGGELPFAAVSPVASSPLHRRKGHTGAMLRRSLALMRERGQVISGLYTPHPTLYRRYGWEVAAEARVYSFKPKDFRPQAEPSQRGRFRALKPEDWERLDAVFRAYAARRNGPLCRTEEWWRSYVLAPPWRQPSDIVLWENESGEPEGYAIYEQSSSPGSIGGSIFVSELIALSGDAYLNLLSYFGRHDIHAEISLRTGSDDRLAIVFADAERLTVRQNYAVLLRVCDFQAAMMARPAASEQEASELTLRVEDADAPWNDGAWRVGVAGGRTWAERTQTAVELALSARLLGPVFNGYLSPSAAVAAGLAARTSEEALRRADEVFRAERAPYFTDSF